MKRQKEQWQPRVNCFLKDMTPVSPSNISVPDNHPVYRLLTKINQERLSA
ncbi:BOW99_gp33 family protein [Streptococcus pyogenes]